MRTFAFSRYALSIGAAVVLLAGCGGPQLQIGAPHTGSGDELQYHKTFNYTSRGQSFKVPAGVHAISVVARGADGGANAKGGRVHATIPVDPGETLYIYVGGAGQRPHGGFNGGARGGEERCSRSCGQGGDGWGGGGASDVRRGSKNLRVRLLVAGGGGGSGAPSNYGGGFGGPGGGTRGGTGGDGSGSNSCGGGGGTGGSQSRGGTGGLGGSCNGSNCYPSASGADGSSHLGGIGGSDPYSGPGLGGGGGGGGGGYYGGGGGASGCISSGGGSGGGGGGGSSYVERSATDVHMWQGWKNATGNGLVVLSW